MFRNEITSTPLSDNCADRIFNIDGEPWCGDISFVATLRALVSSRMGKDDAIWFAPFGEHSFDPDSDYLEDLDVNIYNKEGIYLTEFTRSDPEYCKRALKRVDDLFKPLADFKKLQKITDFFKKSFDVTCYINEGNKTVLLFTDRLTYARYHYLQCAIFAFLPWYFKPEEGITELERKLIDSLRGKFSDDESSYLETLGEFADKYNLKELRVETLLKGFETESLENECVNLKESIVNIKDSIEELQGRIMGYLEDLENKNIRLIGLECKRVEIGESNESEIIEYFKKNKNIELVDCSSGKITFIAKGYLTYYDEDILETYLNNSYSYFYCRNGERRNEIPPEDIKRLMTAVFLEQKIKIRVCANYRIGTNGSLNTYREFDYEHYDCKGYTPNPHIDRYECLGNHKIEIEKILEHHDYIGAINQCIASAESINFSDNAVMSEFMDRIRGVSEYVVDMNCFELPDGSVVNALAAIAWLKENEKEEVGSDE